MKLYNIYNESKLELNLAFTATKNIDLNTFTVTLHSNRFKISEKNIVINQIYVEYNKKIIIIDNQYRFSYTRKGYSKCVY